MSQQISQQNQGASLFDGYRDLGNLSAVDPAYSKQMYCDDCMTTWTGCWDNFQCPECGKGELPGAHYFSQRDQEGGEA